MMSTTSTAENVTKNLMCKTFALVTKYMAKTGETYDTETINGFIESYFDDLIALKLSEISTIDTVCGKAMADNQFKTMDQAEREKMLDVLRPIVVDAFLVGYENGCKDMETFLTTCIENDGGLL